MWREPVLTQPLVSQDFIGTESEHRPVLPGKSSAGPRKKLVRREDHDYSQQLRLGFQLAFLALNVWIGVQFYLWVRWAESAGQTVSVARPSGVEGWLPIE